jgi:transcriptional regulator with XRE-family HTH domain
MNDASDTPSLNQRLQALGISESYASEIANGRRQPSMRLALRIHDSLGEKFGPLAGVADEDIPALRRVHAEAA